MPTKYELQSELRDLNRGFPRMAISKMKMHELEAAIDSVKKLRSGAEEALATKTPSKTGRPSSRPIPVEDHEDEDVIIHVPTAPPERKTKKESTTKESTTKESTTKEPGPKPPARGTKALDNDYGTDLFPGVMRRAKEMEAKRPQVHKCNCSDCPKKK